MITMRAALDPMQQVSTLRPAVPMGTLVFAGLAALLTGIGLGRFAYAALVPGMIAAGHIDVAGAGYLASANVTGYLVGAATGGRIGKRIGTVQGLRVAMITTCLGLAACALPISLLWLILARFVAGVTGGWLMVLAAPSVLAVVPPERRGMAGGIMFTGIGLGIVFSGLVVPLLADLGPGPAWIGLALLASALTIVTWRSWPDRPLASAVEQAASKASSGGRPRLVLLGLAYASDAVGFVPHTVYWVEFVSSELGHGIGMGGIQWTLFGLGAAAGPATMGLIAQRIGFGGALVLALSVKSAAVGLPLVSASIPSLVMSSFLVGALSPATASLAAGRTTELLPLQRRQSAWARLTMLFALVQALGAALMARIVELTGHMALLFLLGSAMLAGGALLAEWHRRTATAASG